MAQCNRLGLQEVLDLQSLVGVLCLEEMEAYAAIQGRMWIGFYHRKGFKRLLINKSTVNRTLKVNKKINLNTQVKSRHIGIDLKHQTVKLGHIPILMNQIRPCASIS